MSRHTLAGNSMFWSDRRLLATTSMQNLGSQLVFGVGSARWPDGPHQSGVAHGFNLNPVSGVGVTFSLGTLVRLGLALSRLPVTFLSADVRST